MPVAVSYPGVYVEEIPSGVRTITGVATSIAAFVDFFPQGPTGSSNAVQIFSYADFQRSFGGLNTNSEASYAIQQFFLNGGSQAYVIRAVAGGGQATATIENNNKEDLLAATALSDGAWGNTLRVDIDYGTSDPTKLFNLTVTQYDSATGTNVVATEKFLNLTVDATSSSDAKKVVNAGSQLIQLDETPSKVSNMPLPSGTVSAALPAAFPTIAKGDALDVTLGSQSVPGGKKIGTATLPDKPTDYPTLASMLQTQIRRIMDGTKFALPNATVTIVGGATTANYIVVKANLGDPTSFIAFADNTGTIEAQLKFAEGPQQYGLASGSDGSVDWSVAANAPAMTNAIIGDPNKKTGMYALLDVDEFNILCIPATAKMPDADAFATATEAIALCTQRRAMYILDTPQADASRETPTAITNWLGTYDSLRSSNAALYFPSVDIPDALNGYAARKVAPSGTLAGIYARTDATRGVWKAPAGTDASLSGVESLEYTMTDGENGVLNPLAINCLRNFPVYGPIVWGARTLKGADVEADDYKYIPVRRLALYIEESLFRGTKWVVFEPNAAPLWSQVRLNVGAFMQNLFQQGAFFGTTPKDAYFVTCDATNNPQDTINLGIINIAVGFAPLKPAEFVILQIQQITGQIAS